MNKFPVVFILLSAHVYAEPPFVPNEVLRKVITHKKVTDFFHTNIIKLSTVNLASAPNVSDLKPKVLLVTYNSTEQKLAFQFSKISWPSSGNVTVWFKYTPEGMLGKVYFNLEKGVAVIAKVEVWEQ